MSGSDPTGFSWLEKVFGDSSGWEGAAAFGGFGAIVAGGAYVAYLGQGGSVSAGGLAGASGLGGAYAVGEAFAGLSDPGANATYARPTGELGQGGLYYDGAAAPPSQTDNRTAAINCGTPERCQQLASDINTMGPMGAGVTGARAVGGLVLTAWRWLVRRTLIRELARQGVKHTPANIVHIERIGARIMFLETGGAKAGLRHIVERHGADFARRGIPEEQIPDALFTALRTNKVVGAAGRGRPIYEFAFNGKAQRVAIDVGDNGFIVGANPVSF